MRHLPVILLFILLLAFMHYTAEQLRFLHAWSVVKKVRVDRLEKLICD